MKLLKFFMALFALSHSWASLAYDVELLASYDYKAYKSNDEARYDIGAKVSGVNSIYAAQGIPITLVLKDVYANASMDALISAGSVSNVSAVTASLLTTPVVEERNKAHLDIVVHFTGVADSALCGKAKRVRHTIGLEHSAMYAVTRTKTGCGVQTLAHEIGHLMGLRHNDEEQGNYSDVEEALMAVVGEQPPSLKSYGKGYVIPNAYGTIMSYASDQNAQRVSLFSSPNARHRDAQGREWQLGDSGHDSVRALREVAQAISNNDRCYWDRARGVCNPIMQFGVKVFSPAKYQVTGYYYDCSNSHTMGCVKVEQKTLIAGQESLQMTDLGNGKYRYVLPRKPEKGIDAVEVDQMVFIDGKQSGQQSSPIWKSLRKVTTNLDRNYAWVVEYDSHALSGNLKVTRQ